ncbi:MAG TPA: 7-cyano-7-deazaguanine synthase, partial [Ktedonobacteraceae bacterium]
EAQGPSPTYVPFRNGTMLSLAAAYAITQGLDRIVIGAHADDARNWAYPDCTPEFMGHMGGAIEVGSYDKVRLATPFQYMTKVQIIEKGGGLVVPFELTWSCYDPVLNKQEPGHMPTYIHCGQCPTCVARYAAFESLGLKDPVEYAVTPKVEA